MANFRKRLGKLRLCFVAYSGSALLAALIRRVRTGQGRGANKVVVILGGAAVGMFAVEVLLSILVPLGAMRASGPL